MLRSARDTIFHDHSFSRLVFARGFLNSVPLRKTEGAGVPECALHPRSRVPLRKGTAHLHTGSAESTPTSPTQWFYGVLRALPGERRCLPPSFPRSVSPQELDATVAAPGPHDLTVRSCPIRP